jgi:glucose/arabinose dehydrogenase
MGAGRLCAFGFAAAALFSTFSEAARKLPIEKIRLPPGFHISLFADEVPDAREMALAPDGTVFVGSMMGNVYALRDRNHDGRADEVIIVARGLRSPNGVAYRGGALYVAEISRIWRYDGILEHLKQPRKPVLVTNRLPKDAWHGWKFIAFSPDGWLYVPVGAPCNVCVRSDERYASILRMRPDGSGTQVFARGVRNTVGFDWSPGGELWFTDNGRDLLGDDSPPDELNRAPRAGLHFGFPFCHGGTVSDPEFGRSRPCSEFERPALTLAPHAAALGMRFYQGSMFPADFRGSILIAEHGSWNRSHKIGYRVMRVRLEGGKPVSYEPFAEGWLEGEKAWGRPVDVLVLPDGSLLVSDDQAGAVYRITYTGK